MRHGYEEKLKNARSLAKQKKFEEALGIVDSVISENVNWFKPYYVKSQIFADQNSWSDAIESLSESIWLKGNEPKLYFFKAYYFMKLHLFHEAKNDLDRLIELEYELDDIYYLETAYFFRALASSYLGDHEAVLADCEHVADDFLTYVLKKHTKEDLVATAKAKLGR